MMQLVGRPAGSPMELIERLVTFALMSLVGCCLVVVEGITIVAAMALRCIAIVLIVLGVTACLTGVFSADRWVSSDFPRGDVGPVLPRIEVGSISKKRNATLGTADNDDVRIYEKVLKASR